MADDEAFPFVYAFERPSGKQDHGELSGLEDDDHPQYLLANGIRAMTGDLIPDTDNLWKLGNSDRRWSDIHVVNAHFDNWSIDELNIDIINEKTNESGVTIDGCLIKDGKVADSDKLDGLDSLDFIKKDGSVAMAGDLKYYVDDGVFKICGGTDVYSATLRLSGKNSDSPGSFSITTPDAAKTADLTRVLIDGGVDFGHIRIVSSHFEPYADNNAKNGDASHRWSDIYAVNAHFDNYNLEASDIPSLDASKITSGTFAVARIPNLDASKITSGTLNLARIPNTLTGKDADTVDGAHKSDLESTMDSKISNHASDASAHHTKTTSSEIDHGSVQGLGDDDHPQYLNTTRHDTTDRHPLGSVVPHDDHGNLSGLGDDDHPQYLLADASRLVSGHLRPDTDVTYNLGASALRWNVIYVAGAYFYGGAMPGADNSYSLGFSTLRWSDIYAVNTHWGDLGFLETTCPKCGKEFEIGDNIILKVIRFNDEDGGIMTVPIHLECANLPPKAIKRKCPVKEHYYVWDEEKGEVVKRTRNKTVKKKVKKKKIKSGYELDMETGKIWKLKKQAKKSVRDKIVEETEAVEEVEEEVEEVLYEEKEFVI